MVTGAWAAGSTGYVTTFGTDTVTPIDVATGTAGAAIPVGSGPVGVAITPDGHTAYVINQGDDTVTPIDVATNAAGIPITVGIEPAGVAITPDGQTVYVTNFGDDTVTPIDVATDTAGTPIPVGAHPFGIAITPPPPAAPVNTTAPSTSGTAQQDQTLTTVTTTSPTPTTPAAPVRLRITAISATGTTIVWCHNDACHYPSTRLRFSVNRATTIRLLLRTRVRGHWTHVAKPPCAATAASTAPGSRDAGTASYTPPDACRSSSKSDRTIT